MLNYFKYISERFERSTLEIKGSYKEVSDFADLHNIHVEIIPKMQSCYVMTDLHGLQTFRNTFKIITEWPGDTELHKNVYEFRISTHNQMDAKILENFFKKFQHYGIYNLKYQDNILNLSSYDTREAILDYLQTILNRVIKNNIFIK